MNQPNRLDCGGARLSGNRSAARVDNFSQIGDLAQHIVSWRRIQVLSVNGEFGMVIAPFVEESATAAHIYLERRPTIVESVLNPEEEQHFSQL